MKFLDPITIRPSAGHAGETDGEAGSPQSTKPANSRRMKVLRIGFRVSRTVFEKHLHILVRRVPKQLIRGSNLEQPTLPEYGDAITEAQRLVQIVGDEHHRFVKLSFEMQELILEFDASECVEGSEWLIEQDKVGVGDQCARDGDPLSLSAG